MVGLIGSTADFMLIHLRPTLDEIAQVRDGLSVLFAEMPFELVYGFLSASRLMSAHGITGRAYAGRVQQIITGSIGFDKWEWGVTLFAKDPLDFKKLVAEMRFDEVSAKYAEFGDFYVGKLSDPRPVAAKAKK